MKCLIGRGERKERLKTTPTHYTKDASNKTLEEDPITISLSFTEETILK